MKSTVTAHWVTDIADGTISDETEEVHVIDIDQCHEAVLKETHVPVEDALPTMGAGTQVVSVDDAEEHATIENGKVLLGENTYFHEP